jgi:hypothetical protein
MAFPTYSFGSSKPSGIFLGPLGTVRTHFVSFVVKLSTHAYPAIASVRLTPFIFQPLVL